MKITEDVRRYAAEQHVAEEEALRVGLEQKAREFAKGLIEKEDDTVRIIYALPGGDLPTEFRTKDKQLLFVMKKVKLK